jgi:hypothetical protein
LLREQIERLCDCLRQQIPGLSVGRLEECKTNLLNQSLPAPHQDWEDAVRRELQTWVRNNQMVAYALLLIPRNLITAGLGLALPASFALGLGALVYIAGGAGIAWLVRHFAKLNLQQAADRAREEWVKSRAKQLKKFISEYFIQPLIGSWTDDLEVLDPRALSRCGAACDFIGTYLRNLDP